jgi:hypothetical protein
MAIEETEGRNKILPVWHRLTKAQVARYSATLAPVYAANTENGIDAIAAAIADVLRPQGGTPTVSASRDSP